ncbi:MAG: histidine kinase dimerization/phospho-acceptor domain-containing protein, partial [Rhodanobacteraceae bacterium]
MKSVRRTAFFWIAAVLASVGVAGALVAFLAGREEANFVFDGQLVQFAQHVEHGMRVLPPISLEQDPEDEVALQIWDATGALLRDVGRSNIPRQTATGFANVEVKGETWRVFTAHEGDRTVQISQRQEVRDEVAFQLAMGAALPIVGALPIVWILVTYALNRLFREFNRTSESIAQRSVDATESLPLDSTPVEMRPFVAAMNELLARQSRAIEQQRRFVSDAAHELRTPLTALQILVDTFRERELRGGRLEGGHLGEDLAQVLRRATALVNQLLKLAEVDAGIERQATTLVDIRDCLLDVVATHLPSAARKRIEFAVHADANPRVLVSPIDI